MDAAYKGAAGALLLHTYLNEKDWNTFGGSPLTQIIHKLAQDLEIEY
jgi:hypothetical protein